MAATLALSPIFLLIALLPWGRWPLLRAAPVAFVLVSGLAPAWWQMFPQAWLAATLRGILIAADIALIIFGAIFFLEFLKGAGVVRQVQGVLTRVSADLRVQVVLITGLFGGFIEGVAGFGTPAAIVAPFLVALGVCVHTAIFLALAANSTAVAFGAVGTPLRVGFADLEISGTAVFAAWINLFVGTLVP